MIFRKLAGPMRIDSANGSPTTYRLKPNNRGRMARTALYQIKVYQSSGANCRIGLDVLHGPDGDVYCPLKADTIAYTSVDPAPALLSGALGAAGSNAEVIGEWVAVEIKIKDQNETAAQWAIVDIFEMWKPF